MLKYQNRSQLLQISYEFFSSTLYYAYTEHEFNKLSDKQSLFDFERLLSNIIKNLKLSILFFSKIFI